MAGGLAEEPPPPLPEVVVPGWLAVAPPVIFAFSIALAVLNSVGAFGEGPDLDALAGEWSRM